MAVQKAALPMGFTHIGQGICNKLQNAAATTALTNTANAKRMAKTGGMNAAEAPHNNSKPHVPPA